MCWLARGVKTVLRGLGAEEKRTRMEGLDVEERCGCMDRLEGGDDRKRGKGNGRSERAKWDSMW